VAGLAIGANRFPELTVTGTITASGGVTGDLTGNVTGDVTGNLTGNSTGTHTSGAATPATAGAIRLGNNECVGWRDFGDTADACLKLNASDQLELDGSVLAFDSAKQD